MPGPPLFLMARFSSFFLIKRILSMRFVSKR
jgi:hypothetical protein